MHGRPRHAADPAEMAPILADAGTRELLRDAVAAFAGAIRARPRPVLR